MKDDLRNMSIAERAEYYQANADRFDEIFDGKKVRFNFDPDTTLTKRDDVLMSLREARTFDAKQAFAEANDAAPQREPMPV